MEHAKDLPGLEDFVRCQCPKCEPAKTKAEERYEAILTEAMAKAASIPDLIMDRFEAPDSDGINWGHVGSAAEVLRQIKAAIEFINNA